ncbi:ABC transporter permease/substrate-binding protein [Anaerococcus sp. Marseille-Q5996]|uniref:ABC transporter permease/substrate-binding protein n=1 Tax=Anaerococcus sp. Marseille-Q5996 TaxID=2972769 RepID=UPI0021C66669|nr:ABC transporter permease/substrate-binding protein [Anaerococcus sp. Marseille-Q5996]
MNNLVTTFNERKADWLVALYEHLEISLISLLIAIFIAIPLAIFLSNRKKANEAILQLTGIFQTIPSLALLGLFIPIMGIGKTPAITALVIYAIFPIYQATVTGLSEIDPSLEEAATAFGMTKWEKLKKYKLSLAMPIIMSGVRTSAIMIIGTATLAALVGAGGLGSFILLGIDRNNSSLILIGAISSALLAILFGALIKLLQNKKPKTILISLTLATLLTLLSLTPFGAKSPKKLVAAGKLGAEPEILINMYKDLIEENTDIEVELKPNFGKTSFLYEALKSGSVDIYPEFTGTITSSLLNDDIGEISNDPTEVYELARDKIYEQDKLSLLKPSEFQNTYAIAVREDFANENNLEKVSDLKNVEDSAVAGFTLEFNDREDGNRGLESLYNLDLDVKTMEPALRYTAIANGSIDITDVYSTDSQIITNKLKVLEDDKKLFPPYQAAPLLRSETLEEYPELEEILGKLAGKINSDEMTKMNYMVDVEGKSANEVAREFLIKEKLIEDK